VTIKTALLVLAAITFLDSSMTVAMAGAHPLKSCATSWKEMAPADKARTTYAAFLSSCRDDGPKQTVAVRPDLRLAPLPCHDYSDCTTQEVISDPKK
jgi:hypothetical protein